MKSYHLIIIILAVAGVAIWYFFLQTGTAVKTTEEALEVLSETPPVTVETNPVKKVPDLNPIEKTNPFKTSNPFQ